MELNFIFLQKLYLIAFGKATFEHAVPVYSFGVYMENKQNIILGYYYLLGHSLAWLIEIMCLCKILGKTLILLGVLQGTCPIGSL